MFRIKKIVNANVRKRSVQFISILTMKNVNVSVYSKIVMEILFGTLIPVAASVVLNLIIAQLI